MFYDVEEVRYDRTCRRCGFYHYPENFPAEPTYCDCCGKNLGQMRNITKGFIKVHLMWVVSAIVVGLSVSAPFIGDQGISVLTYLVGNSIALVGGNVLISMGFLIYLLHKRNRIRWRARAKEYFETLEQKLEEIKQLRIEKHQKDHKQQSRKIDSYHVRHEKAKNMFPPCDPHCAAIGCIEAKESILREFSLDYPVVGCECSMCKYIRLKKKSKKSKGRKNHYYLTEKALRDGAW